MDKFEALKKFIEELEDRTILHDLCAMTVLDRITDKIEELEK